MSAADRWKRIEVLFGSLFEKSAEEQRRTLAAVTDPDLRAEVETLLTAHQELTDRHGFLDELDTSRAAALLARARPQEPSSIGRYRIARRLARGGMGVVYLAHDPRLDRPVALKLLPPYLDTDPDAVRRLGDEARAASALDHTHIETVYEIGDTEDGRVFIAMAYYDGETLRERIGRGPLSVTDTVDLGAQLAAGLSAAHRNGILHRDIKPENLLVTRDGVLKIVDFGVAKILGEELPSAGMPLGTAAYMSPEQTRGEPPDHRTDLWSTGVVLYEMLAGVRPFGGEGEALIHAIRNDSPRPLSEVRPDVPARLVKCVERCLEKDRQRRPESADILARDLREASGPVSRAGSRRSPAARHRARRRLGWIAASILVPATVLAGVLIRNGGENPAPLPGDAPAPGIAVLPFEVRGADLDIWREGMVDLLSANLDGVAGLRAIDSRTTLARWREAVEEAGAPDLVRALRVAHGTGAMYAVTGSVVSRGPGMRLGAEIYALEDGSRLASVHVDGSPDSVFALVDRLSIDILAAIWQGTEQPRVDVDLASITTSSLPALKAYLEGQSLLRRVEFERAIAAYERAIAADSTFAFALYHLGLAYVWTSDGNESDQRLVKETFAQTRRYAARLPEREALLLRGAVEYSTPGHLTSAIAFLREATRKYPDNADAWFLQGEVYFHGGQQVLAEQGESEHALRRAIELDPGFALSYSHLVNNAFIYRPDSARAANLIGVYGRLAPNAEYDREHRVAFGLAFGDSTHRGQALAALDTMAPESRTNLAWGFLDHPRFWGMRDIVLAGRPRPNSLTGQLMTFYLFDNYLAQGRLRTAVAYLEDPLMFPGLRAASYYWLYSMGLAVPDKDLDEKLALHPGDTLPSGLGSTLIWFHAGAYAADQGRWEDHATALARLRTRANRLLAEGDSVESRFTTGASKALSGRGFWRRGDLQRAVPLLVDGQRETTWGGGSASREALNGTIRWWLGEGLLEMARPRDAAVYFESFWNDPLAAERLGPIYERIGDRGKARAAYALFASAWRDADPELRQRARAASAAAERLRSLPDE